MFTIIQGTTPTHTFTTPFDVELIRKARFVYSQNEEVKIIKTGADIAMTGMKVVTTLTQEDTYLLTPNVPVTLVLRVLTKGGDVTTSDAKTGRCRGCADKEVLS